MEYKLNMFRLKNKIFIYNICMWCLFLVNSAIAENVFTWDDCVREALKNHPDLISATAKLDETKANKSIIKSEVFPQINSDLSAKKSKISGKDSIESYSYSITAKQLLFDGSKTSNAIKEARENIKADEYNYMVTSSNVLLNLKTVFAGLLRAQKLVFLTKSIAERRKQNLNMIELRYKAGREHKGSLLTAKANLENAKFEVEQALRNLSLTQTKMVKALGWEKIKPIEISGDFVTKEKAQGKPNFESIADKTPFLEELIAKKDAAQFNLNSKKSDFFPEVYLNSSAGKNASDWPPDQNEWMFGVSVSFPIFEGGSRIAQVSKAKANIKQATADVRSGRNSVIIILEEKWTSYQDSLGTVLVQKKFLEAAEERAKIANAQYSSGLISFDDWIIIEDNLVDRKKSYLNAQANVLISEAQWVQAKGGMLEYEN